MSDNPVPLTLPNTICPHCGQPLTTTLRFATVHLHTDGSSCHHVSIAEQSAISMFNTFTRCTPNIGEELSPIYFEARHNLAGQFYLLIVNQMGQVELTPISYDPYTGEKLETYPYAS